FRWKLPDGHSSPTLATIRTQVLLCRVKTYLMQRFYHSSVHEGGMEIRVAMAPHRTLVCLGRPRPAQSIGEVSEWGEAPSNCVRVGSLLAWAERRSVSRRHGSPDARVRSRPAGATRSPPNSTCGRTPGSRSLHPR